MNAKPVKARSGVRTTEFWGNPLSASLIATGTGILVAQPGALGQAAVLGSGLGLIMAGTAIQLVYVWSRTRVKQAVEEPATSEDLAKRLAELEAAVNKASKKE